MKRAIGIWASLLLGSLPAFGQNFGNIPPSTVIGNLSTTATQPARPMNAISLLGGVVTGDTVLSIGPNIGGIGYTPGFAKGQIWAEGAHNAFIAQAYNDTPYSTNPFLAVGTTGSGIVPLGTASVAFGLYGLGELHNTNGEAVGGEVSGRNFSGANAAPGPTPPTGSPSTNAIVDGFHVTCGTQSGTADCSLGLLIANESGGAPGFSSFDTGETILGFRNIGLYIDPNQTSGTQTSAEIKNSGNGVNLELQTTGAVQPNNAVMTINDMSGNVMSAIYQNGGALFSNEATFNAPNNAINLNLHTTNALIGTNAVLTVTDSGNTVHASMYQNGDIHGNDITAAGYFVGATAGVTCSGAPTASFATVNGIVTHC